MDISSSLDEQDRPIIQRVKKRDIFYQDVGTTAQEKYLSMQAKTDVVRRIRLDGTTQLPKMVSGSVILTIISPGFIQIQIKKWS